MIVILWSNLGDVGRSGTERTKLTDKVGAKSAAAQAERLPVGLGFCRTGKLLRWGRGGGRWGVK